jgi:prepilin-type processing-associated H-X9-DG protein
MRRRITAVVVSLLLVLVGGLLVSAASRSRNAALRLQCRNDLKLVAVGLSLYHDTFGSFPPGTVPNDDLPPARRLSRLVNVLPFCEQIGLGVDLAKAWDDEENLRPKTGSWLDGGWKEGELGMVRIFLCPANPTTESPGCPSMTHYVGVAGVGPYATTLTPGDPGTDVFGYDRKTRLEDIKDGTGTTMLVIETTRDNGPWTAGGFPTVRGLDPAGGPYLGKGGQFGSNHKRGTNVGFADGSVRTLNEKVGSEVFEAMATIAGGDGVRLDGED